jgi:hypothetical protein
MHFNTMQTIDKDRERSGTPYGFDNVCFVTRDHFTMYFIFCHSEIY